MKIVFLTNLYPPFMVGGYEVICAQVLSGLRARGHQCFVLTSTFRGELSAVREDSDVPVRRSLVLSNRHCSDERPNKLERLVPWQICIERYDLALFRRYLREIRPDLLFVWNTFALPLSLLLEARDQGITTVYYLADWTFAWRPSWWLSQSTKERSGLLQRLRGSASDLMVRHFLPYDYAGASLTPEYAILCSQTVLERYRERGVALSEAEVIYPAIPEPPPEETVPKELDGLPTLVYLGRVTEDKGVHTALEAMSVLVNDRGLTDLKLVVVGHIFDPEYDRRLHDIIDKASLQHNVVLFDSVAPEEAGRLLSLFDILVFPSIWEEPFGLTRFEAMARGLTVVTSTAGAGRELFVNGENGLTFTAGNTAELAAQLQRLIEHPELRRQLGNAGRQMVLEKFSTARTIDQIEDYLYRISSEVQGKA